MNEMKDIVKEIIEIAQECEKSDEDRTNDVAYKLAEIVENLIFEMAITINCPSDWRDIGEELAEEYQDNNWVMENCKLYEYDNY